jgi:SAM-dependent methyltransferase
VTVPVEPGNSAPDDAWSELRLGVGTFLLSFVLLSYEVTQLRVFAYSLHPLLVTSVFAITMLGFGIAGSVLGLSTRLRRIPPALLLGWASVGLAVSGLLANAVFARVSDQVRFLPGVVGEFTLAALAVVLLCMLPYAFAGLALGVVLSGRIAAAGRLYALNLAGSGLGCFAVNWLLRPVGAERVLLALLAVGAATGSLFLGRAFVRTRWVVAGTALVLALLVPFAAGVFPFQPDAEDAHASSRRLFRARGHGEPQLEYSAWDPVAKVEIHSWRGIEARVPEPVPLKMLTQDGGASSALLGLGAAGSDGGRLFESTIYGAALALRPASEVLVIGVGGASDVQAALHHRATHVTGVEINGSTTELVAGQFAGFLGDPYGRAFVEAHTQDGRSFVRTETRRYDVLQMSGVDTLTVQSSGSFVLAESYLYTVEAFVDYLRVLKPDGILSVVRFGREPLRLSAIGFEALRRLGEPRPYAHIAILRQSLAAVTLIKRSPWTAAELDALQELVRGSAEANRGIELPPYDEHGMRLSAPLEQAFLPGRRGNEAAYANLLAGLQVGQAPAGLVIPTDDRPYYFAGEMVNYFLGRPQSPEAAAQIRTYVGFIGVLVGAALLLIVAVLIAFRVRGLRLRGSLPVTAYFFLIGFCYMFLEIGLLQKTVLVIEHPAQSFSVVLAALLLASALGSWLSGRLRLAPRTIVGGSLVAIGLFGAAYALWSDQLFSALLPLPFTARMLSVAALIAPLGAAMGFLFPTGLARLEQDTGRLVPWAVGVNGFASVLGSVLSLPVSILFGFTWLFGVGVVCYLLAGLAFLGFAHARPDASGASSSSASGAR